MERDVVNLKTNDGQKLSILVGGNNFTFLKEGANSFGRSSRKDNLGDADWRCDFMQEDSEKKIAMVCLQGDSGFSMVWNKKRDLDSRHATG